MTDKITYGLMISQSHEYGMHRISVEIMHRKHSGDKQDRPLGISSNDQYRAYRDDEPKNLVGLQMQGLGMYGFVSSDHSREPSDLHFIGNGVEYRSVYSIDLDDAARMLRTLKLVAKRCAADGSHESGDVFTSLCGALKLSWVCERIERDAGSRFPEWRWMSIGEGRNRYRQLIKDAVRAAVEAKFPQAAEAA
jgi:hypothetical protein